MRRAITVAIVLAAGLTALVVGTAAGPGPGAGYSVKIVFDTAANLVVGGDFKVAGVVVGKITDIGLTPNHKAEVGIEVTQTGIGPFKKDASCFIGVTSLIGEMFVQCEPGTIGSPELGPAPGQELPVVPVTHTQSPVPVDLVLDTFEQPARERLRLILVELGIGLAGRGEDLNQVLKRTNPTLTQGNRVLKIVAEQNQALESLITQSDEIMAPLSARRKQVAGAIENVNEVATATAARREQLAESVKRLPALLNELKPSMRQLGELSDQAYPIVSDLNASATDLNRFIMELGPLADRAVPATRSLGNMLDVAGPVLTKAHPLINKASAMTKDAKPALKDLALLLDDLRDEKGLDKLVELVFYIGNASAPYDSLGHLLTSRLILNTCIDYATSFNSSCSAKFTEAEGSAAAVNDEESSYSDELSGGIELAESEADGSPAQQAPAGGGEDLSEGEKDALNYLMGE